VSLFGGPVPNLFPFVGAVPAAWPDAIKAGDIHLIAHHLATEDDSGADHAPAINALSAMLETMGGGRIVLGGGRKNGAQFSIGSAIRLGSNVIFEGVNGSGVRSAKPS